MRYLLDSNVLIAAKSLYYKPGFCTVFWSWIDDAHSGGQVFSIDKVKKELMAGDADDHLVGWAAERGEEFFLPTKGTLYQWRHLAEWAENRTPAFKESAKEKFLQAEAADAWLIAFAAHHGDYTIVTNEVSRPDSKKSIQLPDAAAALRIPTISLFDLLDTCAHNNFSFRHHP